MKQKNTPKNLLIFTFSERDFSVGSDWRQGFHSSPDASSDAIRFSSLHLYVSPPPNQENQTTALINQNFWSKPKPKLLHMLINLLFHCYTQNLWKSIALIFFLQHYKYYCKQEPQIIMFALPSSAASRQSDKGELNNTN